ncbi:M48 family metallopeptidase [Phaeocystidibacter marisrubri]|uniref:M48 family metallopeptidase n=1 Tax=Phaeocystidibacter marisrubri TaxID=1577780 RepID=A0A6L3ZIQ1_9FLAO|nr:M48 family metallopeptidase [Phaeocystidibacter marisrubri]KAB2817459.1 M48 family metallopeptidase [Phaeocystidibacter marisrubri]
MKRTPFLLLLTTTLFLIQCSTVPLTGRRQFNLISDNEMMSMSFSQYDQVLSESKLSQNTAQVQMVKRVGERISAAVTNYLNAEGHSELLEGFAWEFNLIESDELNAWCMPGGKVAFYTGIMDVCQSEAGVAVVMGHEVAHAIARHGNERMSQALGAQLGGLGLSVALADQPEKTQSLAMMAYGIGAQYGAMLPFSRLHESEADELGLYFMAMAGYNPQEAPKFWQRMSAMSGGSIPEFMSTHPSHNTRITDLNGWMTKATEYYNSSSANNGTTSNGKLIPKR